jgi:predicted RNase H-like HicB family nuclease
LSDLAEWKSVGTVPAIERRSVISPGAILGTLAIMYNVATELEVDGRWIAEVVDLPGVLAYGQTREEAVRRAQALSLHVLAERLENGESIPQVESVFAIVA